MPSKAEFHELFHGLLTDLQSTNVLWQIMVLLASFAVAWWLQAHMTRHTYPHVFSSNVQRIGVGSINRLIFPISALVLVLLGRWVLKYEYSVNLLSIAIPLIFSYALIRVVVYMLRRTFSSREWLRPWERYISWGIWFGVMLYLTGLLPEVLKMLDAMSFSVGQYRISVLLVGQGVLSVAITMLLALWLGSAMEARVMGAAAMHMSLRVMIAKIIRAVLVLLGVLIALSMVGIDITLLSVFGGALGVGLGLGLQKIVSNYISGFIILMDRSLRIEDSVIVDNHSGKVTELTMRYVVLKATDGSEVLIPNDIFVTSAVVNKTYSDLSLCIGIPVQISYASPLEIAMQILLTAAKNHEYVLAEPAPQVFLVEFADNGISLRLDVWVEHLKGEPLPIRSAINMEIWREFQKQGIKIPFPQREVIIKR